MSSPDSREDWIFSQAQHRSLVERAAFLDGACGEDSDLRDRVAARLACLSGDSAEETVSGSASTAFATELASEEELGAIIGRYRLLEKIGEGGFGVVYAAEQREPVKRRVALKIIKLGMDTRQVIARFESERQALALMDHPNIAKVLDGGATSSGRPYFVMEWVHGISITRYCDQNNLPTEKRLKLFAQVCQAIQHAHQKGVIHRDIKPSNILVTLQEPDGAAVPKVIDFGIAKATQQQLTDKTIYTRLEQFIGTPAYMSPEQAEMSALDIDTRSDIYSLGVLLYELLVGRTPFEAHDLLSQGIDAMRKTIREKDPVRPSTRLGTLPILEQSTTAKRRAAEATRLISQLRGDLDWIVMKCLEKDRTLRYDTANGLGMDIQRHLRNEPVVARPPNTTYRVQKFVRRNKVAVVAAAAVAAILVLGTLVSTWQAVLATHARREQSRLRKKAEAQELEARQRAYASDMNLVQQALAVDNLARAQELLSRQRPQPGQRDLRGWEWRYLWQRCTNDAVFKIGQLSGPVFSLSTSRDLKWLAAGGRENGELSIWDFKTQEQIPPLPAGDGEVLVAFSPVQPLLAFSFQTGSGSTNFQQHIRLWNLVEKKRVADIELGAAECLGLAFSQSGQTLVSSTGDPVNQISVWRVPEGTNLTHYLPAFQSSGAVPSFALTADLSMAAHGMDHGTGAIRLLDLSNGRERFLTNFTRSEVTALAFSRDKRLLASSAGYGESSIQLWEMATGRELGRLTGHHGWVASLVFGEGDRTLISASSDQTIRVWDVPNLQLLGKLLGHRQEVWRLALLPDGTTLVSGSKDGAVFVWNTSRIRTNESFVIVPFPLATWSFSPDSKRVIGLGRNGQVGQWEGPAFAHMESLVEISKEFGNSLISQDANLLAVASTNGGVQVWDLSRRALVRELQVSSGWVWPVAFLAQGSKLAVVLPDWSIHEWDLHTGRETQVLRTSRSRWPGWVTFSADQRKCLTVGDRGDSVLRDISSGQEKYAHLDVRDLMGLCFSPDGVLFAAASELSLAKVWQTASFREVATFRGFLQAVHSVAFSPDAKCLATGSDGKEAVRLWDLESQQEVLTLEGQNWGFAATAFSPNGNLLGSMNQDGRLHIWQAPSWDDIETAEKIQSEKP